MTRPLIEISGLWRTFEQGGETVAVLKDIDLAIEAGEMVAIMGASGSGKSTLMNILGCLDTPTSGTYRFDGQDVAALDPDALAALRREHFGFIFQRYQLLADLDALENVEVPAIYAGAPASKRRARAQMLLERLGLGERLTHRPWQLSGGQQQRVSVARALMNGGDLILADEPTGALDSRSGKELMALLKELNAAGHTIVIVTHDAQVAGEAQRIIEIRDGVIVADRRNAPAGPAPSSRDGRAIRPGLLAGVAQVGEALRMALRAMWSHRLRTFLTMLGIIIGIASVVGVVALGQGSQQQVLENIASIGTNTINVFPGSGFGDMRSGRVRTLVPSDAAALAEQPYADSVTPAVSTNTTGVYRNVSANVSVQGVGEGHFQVNGIDLLAGVLFDAGSVSGRTQEAVIDANARDTFFADGTDPLGKTILIGRVPVRVIGVSEAGTGFGPAGNSINIYLPYTTVMTRILGQEYLSAITVRVADDYDIDQAQAEIEQLLVTRHGTNDVYLMNTNTIRETITSTSQTMTLLISMIAVISLVVGGIGVMNIMLVSVTERTREIGVRMAIGARRGDILSQFLIEAVLVCLMGGAAGVILAFGAGAAAHALMSGVRLVYSSATVLAAFASSSLIGIIFGFMPARAAARLDPVVALARE